MWDVCRKGGMNAGLEIRERLYSWNGPSEEIVRAGSRTSTWCMYIRQDCGTMRQLTGRTSLYQYNVEMRDAQGEKDYSESGRGRRPGCAAATRSTILGIDN